MYTNEIFNYRLILTFLFALMQSCSSSPKGDNRRSPTDLAGNAEAEKSTEKEPSSSHKKDGGNEKEEPQPEEILVFPKVAIFWNGSSGDIDLINENITSVSLYAGERGNLSLLGKVPLAETDNLFWAEPKVEINLDEHEQVKTFAGEVLCFGISMENENGPSQPSDDYCIEYESLKQFAKKVAVE